MLKLFPVSKYLTLEQCSLLTSENYMMVLKAKLEISCSSTIVIKEVFANSPRIRSYRITKSRCEADSEAPESVLCTRQCPTGHRPLSPRGVRTSALARSVRPERAHKRRTLPARSTHSLSPSPARFASPKQCVELVVHRRSSVADAHHRHSLTN